MNLKKIKLHNIRSYIDEEIEFPSGSLLLSGEAGSGKSSILICIEFALFGITKGKEGVNAEGIIRRGADEGSVELFFNLDGKSIEIKRVLRRKSEKVKQVEGILSIDGNSEKLSSDELKTKVLQLFNYPLEFIKKGKGLPFHYTVYAQQEQMKSILLEGTELRLDTLRRVFGIDRYKIIKENSEVFQTALREKIKEKEGSIYDLDDKILQRDKQKQELTIHKNNLENLEPELNALNNVINDKKKDLEFLDEKIKDFRLKKDSLNSIKSEISIKQDRFSRNKLEIENITKENLDEEINFDIKEFEILENSIKELEEKIENIETEVLGLIKVGSKLEAKKESIINTQNKIKDLNTCPECNQEVTDEHRKEIIDRSVNELEELNQKYSEVQNLKNEKNENKQKLIESKSELILKEKQLREIKIKKDSIIEKINKKKSLNLENEELKLKIDSIQIQIENLEKELLAFKESEEIFLVKRKELDEVLSKKHELEINKAGIVKVIEGMLANIDSIDLEIKNKQKISKDMVELKELKEWLSKNFISILLKIEQSVLATLHTQFDSLLKKWFAMLMDEPEISVRLDTSFSPVVEQAGYDTDYSHLSGGERTAVALAYRLALNQVINLLISQIKTRNLLILDEPTEGFSHSQLDKMRNVFSELNLDQLMIISHNPKIESFVDNVIKVRKEGHISKVIK